MNATETPVKIADREVHPAALLFPELGDADRLALRTSILEHGLQRAIVLDAEGRILDGRHRAQACKLAGVDPHFEVYRGDAPVAFVMAANLHRRHLEPGQRAMVAAALLPQYEAEAAERRRLASVAREADKRRVGQLAHSAPESWTGDDDQAEPRRARDEVGKATGVPGRTVERAAKVREHGAPELVEAVRSGSVRVSTAADLTELSLEEQAAVIAKGEREILARAKEIRATKQEKRRGERIEKIAVIAQGNKPLEAGPERYALVMADPPWQYDAPNSESRAIENHYPTMPTEEICALPVGDMVTPDAILFLWATVPLLEDALAVMKAWGFRYATHQIWDKTGRTGMGRWLRVEHELLIWGVRGSPPIPKPSERPESVLEAPVGEHSAKPAIFAQHIERAYAGLPRIELFCRSPREGWAAWGNQAEADAEVANG